MQGGRFRKGISGNPAGKPKGARHRATLLVEKLMQDDAQAIVQTVVSKAIEGDMVAARLVLDRIAPPRRGRPVTFTLPAMVSARDIAAAIGAVALAVGRGILTPEEAESVATVLEIRRRALEMVDIEERLAALERHAETVARR